MTKLRDYYFIDEHRIRILSDQIADRFIDEERKGWTIGASLTGPKLESNRSEIRRERNLHERIELLLSYLRTVGDLREGRPQTSADAHHGAPRYVLEHTDAVKLIVSTPRLAPVSGLTSLALWVSDPDFSIRSEDRWAFVGSFLYLVEAHWDESPFHTTYSGCSALQAIINTVEGRDLIDRPRWSVGEEGYAIPESWEPLGRGSNDHPIEKLQRLGATVSDRRRITTLYRLRYMTNEQCFVVDGETRRFNDILGYPMFIASAL